MDTRLVNSQLISKKDVRVWFFEGGREYAGPAVMVADNGLVFHTKPELPKGTDPLTFLDGLSRALKGKTVQAEVVSPKIKLEVRLLIAAATPAATRNPVLSITATWLSPPDPRALKLLLEPVVTRAPKKS